MYTRSARVRLEALPLEVQLHLETHLENLALLAETTSPQLLSSVLTRDGEEGFITAVSGAQARFVLNAVAGILLVYRIEPRSAYAWESSVDALRHE